MEYACCENNLQNNDVFKKHQAHCSQTEGKVRSHNVSSEEECFTPEKNPFKFVARSQAQKEL